MTAARVIRWLAVSTAIVVSASCTVIFDYGEDPPGVGGGLPAGGAGPGTGGGTQSGGGGGGPACQDVSDCDDASDCTEDRCEEGSCVHVTVDAGTVCQNGGGQAGICEGNVCVVACTEADPSVCDDDNDCTVDSCDTAVGQCSNVPVADGPVEGGQTSGDCQVVVCDGGVMKVEADPGDPFVDGNACTEDLCEGTTPVNPTVPEGTSCGPSLVCSASGVCQGCITAADCPGSDTFCQSRSCNNGVCGVVNTANGTALPSGSQTAGPCKEIQCNGSGGTKTVNRPTGTPCDDGLFCNGVESCLSGNCSQLGTPPCPGPDDDANCKESCNEATDSCNANDPNRTPCNDGVFCNGNDTCQNGNCTASDIDPCPGPDGDGNCKESCNEATDSCNANDPNGEVCNDGLYCTLTDKCQNGVCVGTGDPCFSGAGDDCYNSCNEAQNNCTAQDPEGASCTYMMGGQLYLGCCTPTGSCVPQCV